MSNQKGINTSICLGCLATNRTLTSIENYFHIYQNIIEKSTKIKNNEELRIPQMCWECVATLRKFEKFKQKVLEAKKYLLEKNKKDQIQTLSTLVLSTDQKIIDITYTDEKYVVNDIKIDIEVLKEEPIDYEPPTDTNCDDCKDVTEYDELLDNKDTIKECIKEEFVKDDNDYSDRFDTFREDSDTSVKNKKRKGSKKYKVIYITEGTDSKMYGKVKIDDEERAIWLEQEKKGRNYRLMAYKCELCISGFAKEKYYLKHVKTFHSETSGAYTCDLCKIQLRTKGRLYLHIKEHYTKYVCNACPYQSYNDHQMRTHLYCAHKRAVECLKCGLRFVQFPHFYDHFKKLHLKVVCDYCGQNFTKKSRLAKHIRMRHSYEHKCDQCDKSYRSFHALVRHTNLHHVKSARELCYCVECNIQFDNVTLYTRHLKRSVKHRVVTGVPCPECNKVYHRRHVMLNHYNLVHLNKTKHYCELCDRYFLNGFRIRQHIASVHEKVPRVKNKMCPYCERGFSTNRILENHIRTHTGERPFACVKCTATFAQRQALVSHTRAIHKILDFK